MLYGFVLLNGLVRLQRVGICMFEIWMLNKHFLAKNQQLNASMVVLLVFSLIYLLWVVALLHIYPESGQVDQQSKDSDGEELQL